MKLTEMYYIHMLLILGYTVSNNLTLIYQQYMGLTRPQFDSRLLTTEIAFIVLSLVEILMIINSIDEAESLSQKVLREVHLINYWQKTFDCRLKHSVSGNIIKLSCGLNNNQVIYFLTVGDLLTHCCV